MHNFKFLVLRAFRFLLFRLTLHLKPKVISEATDVILSYACLFQKVTLIFKKLATAIHYALAVIRRSSFVITSSIEDD